MKEFNQIAPQPELGRTCKEVREKYGLSVEDFSTRYNVTRQTVYNFENGETDSLRVFRAYIDLAREEGIE